MPTPERRSGDDRRSTNRYTIDIAVEWETAAGRFAGSISDVSFDGCFVLASGEIENGESVRLFVPLADGMRVQFTGKVANSVYEIGFGIRFDPLSAPQRDLLVTLVRSAEPL